MASAGEPGAAGPAAEPGPVEAVLQSCQGQLRAIFQVRRALRPPRRRLRRAAEIGEARHRVAAKP